MEKVIAYLNKHYTESIGLDEIASYTAMNPTAFCDTLKKTQEKHSKSMYLICVSDMLVNY